MAEADVTGAITKINVCFKVNNISKLDKFWSPEVSVQGIPWKIQVCKEVKEEGNLAVYLFCEKKDKPEDWSHPAFVTFKLLSFNDSANPVEYSIDPYVFDNRGTGYGATSLINWPNLFDIEKKYVENDTINLDINIEAADPDEASKSKIKFEKTGSSCDDGCVTTFRLSVTNIENLIAARSPTFNMRKLPWDLTVYKSRSSKLSVRLESKTLNKKISFKGKAIVKLMSSKGDGKAVEVTRDKSFKSSSEIFQFEVVSWDELLKPENEFINNDSIVMEVKIKMRNSDGDDQIICATSAKGKEKPQKMECPICFETIGGQEVSSTKCGHLFCTECITESVEDSEKCPSCNAAVTPNDFHPVYLPFTN